MKKVKKKIKHLLKTYKNQNIYKGASNKRKFKKTDSDSKYDFEDIVQIDRQDIISFPTYCLELNNIPDQYSTAYQSILNLWPGLLL